jgi:CubicO group peptidase (beta-lactamase class C family)
VRELLSHTSGYDCECGDLARFGDGDDVLERLTQELPGVRRWIEPGTVWSYANTGYWLAAQLAALSRGLVYEELVGEVIAEAGLTATSFGAPELAGTGAGATSAPYPRARRPSGGLVSNVGDLLRFGHWLLTDPATAGMRVPIGRPVRGVYGLGLAGERVGGREVWGHGGSYGGFQSSFLVVPSREAVFVGLTNSAGGRQALRELEDGFFERVLGARRPVCATVTLDAGSLGRFAGGYANPSETFELRAVAGGLELAGPDGVSQARPIGPRTFEVVGEPHANDRFDFPLDGFARVGGRLSERVS